MVPFPSNLEVCEQSYKLKKIAAELNTDDPLQNFSLVNNSTQGPQEKLNQSLETRIFHKNIISESVRPTSTFIGNKEMLNAKIYPICIFFQLISRGVCPEIGDFATMFGITAQSMLDLKIPRKLKSVSASYTISCIENNQVHFIDYCRVLV